MKSVALRLILNCRCELRKSCERYFFTIVSYQCIVSSYKIQNQNCGVIK